MQQPLLNQYCSFSPKTVENHKSHINHMRVACCLATVWHNGDGIRKNRFCSIFKIPARRERFCRWFRFVSETVFRSVLHSRGGLTPIVTPFCNLFLPFATKRLAKKVCTFFVQFGSFCPWTSLHCNCQSLPICFNCEKSFFLY